MNLSTAFPVIVLSLWLSTSFAQPIPQPVLDAMSFNDNQLNSGNGVTYIFREPNDGRNHFIALKSGNINFQVSQEFPDDATGEGSYCVKVDFPLGGSPGYSEFRYHNCPDNWGGRAGSDFSGVTKLYFWVRGQGRVEVIVGGVNQLPFKDSNLPHSDGVGLRSTGYFDLTNEWKLICLDLTNNTFYAYKSWDGGANNKFTQWYKLTDFYSCASNLNFTLDGVDETGHHCIRADWNKPVNSPCWAGITMMRWQGDFITNVGYNMSGVDSLVFLGKLSKSGKVKIGIGSANSSCGAIDLGKVSLTPAWQRIALPLPKNKDYTRVVAGFYFAVAPDIGTPDSVAIFFDSIQYVGVELSHDFGHLINGFTLSAPNILNPSGAVVWFDEVYYNKDQSCEPQLARSFVTQNEPFDLLQTNAAHIYDNSLLLIANLALYYRTGDQNYLKNARIIGDAFVYAMSHDRFYSDGGLRNAYKNAHIKLACDSTAALPGVWVEDSLSYFEDIYFVGASTGNIAWSGISLVSLYEVTQNPVYLTAAKGLADWCILYTKSLNGFTGGREGWDNGTAKFVTWLSTEHNEDVYALCTRLYEHTNDQKYKQAADLAADFVKNKMWNSAENHFWTGTAPNGIDPNKDNIPLDIHPWYIMAFRDTGMPYAAGMTWAKDNCYISHSVSPFFPDPVWGFDFNTDRDKVWYEGCGLAALGYRMLGDHIFADSLLRGIEYVQKHGVFADGLGIVAASDYHLSTGFLWEYFTRLHVAPSCWYVFAKLCVNPYYNPALDACQVISTNQPIMVAPVIQVFPNPVPNMANISIQIPFNSAYEIALFDISGKQVRLLSKGGLANNSTCWLTWDGSDNAGGQVPNGVYIIRLLYDGHVYCQKIIMAR